MPRIATIKRVFIGALARRITDGQLRMMLEYRDGPLPFVSAHPSAPVRRRLQREGILLPCTTASRLSVRSRNGSPFLRLSVGGRLVLEAALVIRGGAGEPFTASPPIQPREERTDANADSAGVCRLPADAV